ncbi:hypothetical protein ACI65C_006791 [Semiaphis heraclei]
MRQAAWLFRQRQIRDWYHIGRGLAVLGLSVGQRICEKHFSSADIVREKIVKDSTGNILIKEKYKHAIIKQVAVPCVKNVFSSFEEFHKDTDDDILATPLSPLITPVMNQKKDFQKHGLLIFDEISLRESISVYTTTLKYSGLIDFGDEEGLKDLSKAKCLIDKATHGLVFLFQPLADFYTQLIAVFASKGPVNGLTLAQLVIKAVVLLENAGAKVHGLVSDGAQTNRKVWAELGISGILNDCISHIEHFVDENRQFFIFSDTPHLFKNVRNRLHNNRELMVDSNDGLIKWEHFEILHEEDKKVCDSQLRVCPKITDNHLQLLNTCLKMRVRLAVQVLINSLKWLDSWESKILSGEITEKLFLTKSTTEGLRVTLNSTIAMTNYLVEKFEFKYILTGKINQDALERFFGTVQMASGANDHPATPTFLQVYKLLSIYAVIKPPKYGNCTVDSADPAAHLIKLSDIKQIYTNTESKNPTALQNLKNKLDDLIDYGRREFIDIVEHDYVYTPVIDCLKYYITGYLCHQLSKKTKCQICKNAFISTAAASTKYYPEADLINIKTKGKLTYPNMIFYKLISEVEDCFIKNINSPDVFEKNSR